jgi:hypothetical protein
MASPTRIEGTGPVRRGTDRFDEWPDTEPGAALTGPSDLGDHLDLEDEAVLSWGLAQSVSAEGPKAKIDVLYGVGDELGRSTDHITRLHLSNDREGWQTDVREEILGRLLQVRRITSHTFDSI